MTSQTDKTAECRFREFRPEDTARLPRLLKTVWGRDSDEAYWRWRYLDPPFETQATVVEDEDEIVAFIGYWIRSLQVGSAETKGYMIVDVMAHPDYRGGRVYGRLYQQAKELMADRIVFGYTNEVSHRVFAAFLGRTIKLDVAAPVLVSPIRAGQLAGLPRPVKDWLDFLSRSLNRLRFSGKTSGPIEAARTGEIDADFDRLWREAADRFPAVFRRDRAYLTWRYLDAPGGGFQVWRADEAGRLVGYMITAIAGSGKRKRGFIVDWLVLPERADVFGTLLRSAMAWLAETGADAVEAWSLDLDRYWPVGRAAQLFVKTGRSRTFLLGGDRHELLDLDSLTPADLFMTLGDSDYLTLP